MEHSGKLHSDTPSSGSTNEASTFNYVAHMMSSFLFCRMDHARTVVAKDQVMYDKPKEVLVLV